MIMKNCEIVEFTVILKDGKKYTIRATVIDEVVAPISKHPYDTVKIENLIENTGIALSEPIISKPESVEIDLLIGLEFFHQLVNLNAQLKVENNLFLIATKFGWMLSGAIESENGDFPKSEPSMVVITGNRKSVGNKNIMIENDISLGNKIPDSFWNLESAGILDSPYDSDNDVALQKINDSIVQLEDGRYQVELPKKDDLICDLKDNYAMAYGQLRSNYNRLSSEEKKHYDSIVKEQVDSKMVEEIIPELIEGPVKHYLCHHGVKRPDKPTHPLRVVFNASASMRKLDYSLNDCLYPGPNLLNNLVGMLVRFRLGKIILIGDIEKAFLQIAIKPEDRDLTRWLWVRDINNPSLEGNVVEYRFPRLPWGLNCSPVILESVNAFHLKKENTETSKQILDNIYVDNVIGQVDTVEDGKLYYSYSKGLFAKCEMNLREWYSNSTEILEFIPEIDKGKGTVTSVLGLQWDTITDTISVKGANKLNSAANTKRQVLHSAQTVYDPLGLFAPLTVKAKLFIQSCFAEKLDWDTEMTKEKQKEWAGISAEISQIKDISSPRFIGLKCPNSENVAYEIYCFTDASPHAYSAALYLRIITTNSTESYLLLSKNRLAPIKTDKKKLFLPRLELLGVWLGITLIESILKELSHLTISKISLFSDSECVLHWLQTTKQLTVFVSNRRKRIKKFALEKNVTFRYVASPDNPADLATKTQSNFETLRSDLWLHGPKWLSRPSSEWPSGNIPEITSEKLGHIISEIKTESVTSIGLLAGEGPKRKNQKLTDYGLFDLEKKYSLRLKVLRVTAYVLRFVLKTRKQATENAKYFLKAAEIQKAKEIWEKHVQKEKFAEIFESVINGTKNQLKDQLGIYIDKQGLLRCSGRLVNSELPEDTKFPKLLPSDCDFTRLTVEEIHSQVGHSKTKQTLATLRQEYWVPKGRITVQKIIEKCQICKTFEGGPFEAPKMAALPKARVVPSRPFTYTGVDYLGPLFIKETEKDGTKFTSKVWICLFTCLSVRAVHLELVKNLSAEHFLMALRRFIARRGKPKQITSDNAPNFKLTSEAIKNLWDQTTQREDVQSYVANQGIKWHFIPEYAPWFGGFYERLVGLVKRSLRKSLGRLCLSLEQLRTLTSEIEAIINSRPLVHVSSEFEDRFCLTPADFLSLNPRNGFAETDNQNDQNDDPDYQEHKISSAEQLLQTWKRGQKHLDHFWKVWQSEYLLSLRERGQNWAKHPKIRVTIPPKEGQTVLIKEPFLPRGSWKFGRIETLCPSTDGIVRSARIRLPNRKLIVRPIKILHPTEIPEKEDEDIITDDNVPEQEEEIPEKSTAMEPEIGDEKVEENSVKTDSNSGRQRRQAWYSANKKIADWCKELQ